MFLIVANKAVKNM